MSLYFTLLFVFLISEIGFLSLIVLPLPHRIRKLIYKGYSHLLNRQEYRTVGIILWIIIGLLFIDSWKRAHIPINLPHTSSSTTGNNLETLQTNDPVTSIQVFATRAYNQRNVYISGFILYFMIVIPSVMTLIRRLIKYQELINNKGKDEQITGDKDLDKLRAELKQRNASLEGLKRQIANYEKHFDESVKGDENNEDPELKKNQ